MDPRDTRTGHDPGPSAPSSPLGGEGRVVPSTAGDFASLAPTPVGPPRRARRSLAQREAAAKMDLAALAADRRRLRTRGMIVAGTLLVGAVRARPVLASELAAAIRALPERDREAVALFAPELA